MATELGLALAGLETFYVAMELAKICDIFSGSRNLLSTTFRMGFVGLFTVLGLKSFELTFFPGGLHTAQKMLQYIQEYENDSTDEISED